jgi:hypothetical protein
MHVTVSVDDRQVNVTLLFDDHERKVKGGLHSINLEKAHVHDRATCRIL